jgi:hypothetical protein
LKQAGAIPNIDAQQALEKVLEERWAYDDLFEDESEDELVSSGSMDGVEEVCRANEIPPVDKAVDADISISSILSEAVENDTVDESFYINVEMGNCVVVNPVDDNQTELGVHGSPLLDVNLTTNPFVDDIGDIIFMDSDVANEEMIAYYTQMAYRGESLRLKSVESEETQSEFFL